MNGCCHLLLEKISSTESTFTDPHSAGEIQNTKASAAEGEQLIILKSLECNVRLVAAKGLFHSQTIITCRSDMNPTIDNGSFCTDLRVCQAPSVIAARVEYTLIKRLTKTPSLQDTIRHMLQPCLHKLKILNAEGKGTSQLSTHSHAVQVSYLKIDLI